VTIKSAKIVARTVDIDIITIIRKNRAKKWKKNRAALRILVLGPKRLINSLRFRCPKRPLSRLFRAAILTITHNLYLKNICWRNSRIFLRFSKKMRKIKLNRFRRRQWVNLRNIPNFNMKIKNTTLQKIDIRIEIVETEGFHRAPPLLLNRARGVRVLLRAKEINFRVGCSSLKRKSKIMKIQMAIRRKRFRRMKPRN
jgi:hypothetical protein